jgi:hypothetical protein
LLPESTSGQVRHDPVRLADAVFRIAATRRPATRR